MESKAQQTGCRAPMEVRLINFTRANKVTEQPLRQLPKRVGKRLPAKTGIEMSV